MTSPAEALPEPTNQEDLLLSSGDVEINKIELWSSQHTDPFDLKEIWKNISIYEDIETNYIRGEITLVDSQNILMDAPIITNEKIVIEFQTSGHKEFYKLVAAVTEVSNQTAVRQGMQIYVLSFISPEFARNQKTKFSKAYNKRLISDMVVDIYDNYIRDVRGKELNVVPTTGMYSRVVPTMSPFKAINWLCKWARGAPHNDGGSFLFFENQNGFYFGSIEALVDSSTGRKPAAVYSRSNIHAQEDKNKDIKTGFYTLTDVIIDTPDVINNLTQGFYSSKMLVHDPVLRTIGTSTFDYFKSFGLMAHLEKDTKKGGMEQTTLHNDTRLGSYSDSYVINAPEHYASYGLGTESSTSYLQRRVSQMAQLGAIQLTIVVAGDSDRATGEVVEIKLPAVGTSTLKGREGEQDKYLSGRYLISSIRHEINAGTDGKDKYALVMNVVKDAYGTPLPEQLITHWT